MPGLRTNWRWLLGSDLVLLITALGLYISTLAPTVYRFDSAELAAGAYSLGIVHPTGYPLYLLIAKFFTLIVPVGDIAFRVNLLSAVCAALSLVVVRKLMLGIGVGAGSALLATLMFAVCYSLWALATVAEVYTLHLLFVASVIYLVVRWTRTHEPRFFVSTAFVLGLSFGNHMATSLLLPGLAWLLWVERRSLPRPRVWVLGALLGCVGPLSYVYLPLRYAARPALNYAAAVDVDLNTVEGFLWMARGSAYAHLMFQYSLLELPREIYVFALHLWQNFFGVGAVLALVGVVEQWRRDRQLAALLLWVFAATAIFNLGFRVADKDTFFLPTYLVTSLWFAVGIQYLCERVQTPAIVSWGLVVTILLVLTYNYPLVDRSNDRSARNYAEAVFQNMPRRALIIGAWANVTPLKYLQVVDGERPDISVLDWVLHYRRHHARLLNEGVPGEQVRDQIDEDLRGIVAEALAAGRSVFSLEDNPVLRQRYLLVGKHPLYSVRVASTPGD